MGNEKTIDESSVPQLIVLLPDGKEVCHSVVGRETSIGRDPSNRISISDHFVSQFHAKLLVSRKGFTLVDLGSSNKTLVNGREVSTNVTVRFGDKIQFAGVTCRLEPPGAQEGEKGARAPASSPATSSSPATTLRSTPTRRSVSHGAAAAAPAEAPPAPVAMRTAPQAVTSPSTAPAASRNSRTRLYLIGGVLLGIVVVMVILLRLLLGASEVPAGTEAEQISTPPAAVTGEPASGESISPTGTSIKPISPEGRSPLESPTAPSPVAKEQ